MVIYPAPVGGLVLLLCLVWVILEMRKNTAKERKARHQERLDANRTKIQENVQAIGDDLQKIPKVVKIVIGLSFLFLAFVFLVICFLD